MYFPIFPFLSSADDQAVYVGLKTFNKFRFHVGDTAFDFNLCSFFIFPSLVSHLSILELVMVCMPPNTLLILSNDEKVGWQLLQDQIKLSNHPCLYTSIVWHLHLHIADRNSIGILSSSLFPLLEYHIFD